MKSLFIGAIAFAAANLITSPALADPVKIDTTRKSVDKQCGLAPGGGHKSGCTRSCGRSKCTYHCEGTKCTVTIARVAATTTRPPVRHDNR